ncbi:MAG: tetratricopeptide repeat protein [Bacteroidetes bacterium]|nr:tetratricopeptide repeat protein [Bacteroidota bacterium]
MKKNIPVILMLGLFPFSTMAQKQGQERIDSLIGELPKSIEDTNKVILLNDLSFSFYSTNPDKGIEFGNQALTLAERLQWKQGVAQANGRIGVNYFGKADYPQALAYWLKALKLNEELNNKRAIGINLGNIGNVYLTKSEYSKALDYYFKASKINEEVNNKNALALNLGNIGTVYGYQLQYSKGLDYFLKALKIYEELQDQSGIARSSISIGNVYQGLKDYSKAFEYNFKALRLVQESGVSNLIAISHTNIGKIYLDLATDSNKTQLTILMGGNKTATLQLAKAYNDSAITVFKEIGDISALYQTYQSLSDIQSLMGDKTGALESYKNYALFKDSVFNMEKDKKITETAMQYEFDKKEAATKSEQEKKIFNNVIFVIQSQQDLQEH